MNVHPVLRRPLLAAILAAAAATATWQLWPQAQARSATSSPAWFQPIAAYYHDDPAITPGFDFASLYAGYPPWFQPIAAYYHGNPAITPQFDFASLYGD